MFHLLVDVLMVAAVEVPIQSLEKPVAIAWFDAIKYSEMSLAVIPSICKELGMVDSHYDNSL